MARRETHTFAIFFKKSHKNTVRGERRTAGGDEEEERGEKEEETGEKVVLANNNNKRNLLPCATSNARSISKVIMKFICTMGIVLVVASEPVKSRKESTREMTGTTLTTAAATVAVAAVTATATATTASTTNTNSSVCNSVPQLNLLLSPDSSDLSLLEQVKSDLLVNESTIAGDSYFRPTTHLPSDAFVILSEGSSSAKVTSTDTSDGNINGYTSGYTTHGNTWHITSSKQKQQEQQLQQRQQQQQKQLQLQQHQQQQKVVTNDTTTALLFQPARASLPPVNNASSVPSTVSWSLNHSPTTTKLLPLKPRSQFNQALKYGHLSSKKIVPPLVSTTSLVLLPATANKSTASPGKNFSLPPPSPQDNNNNNNKNNSVTLSKAKTKVSGKINRNKKSAPGETYHATRKTFTRHLDPLTGTLRANSDNNEAEAHVDLLPHLHPHPPTSSSSSSSSLLPRDAADASSFFSSSSSFASFSPPSQPVNIQVQVASDDDEAGDLGDFLGQMDGPKPVITPNSGASNDSLSSFSPEMTFLESVGMIIPCVLIILATIVGNVLVIVAIFTYRPLKQVQHMYLVSLAVADITVAVFVLPFNIIYTIRRRWDFGLFVCKFWLTCDICCCTASILNLCAIAIDRYQAIHDPINYAQKRTMKRVLTGIVVVWLLSTLISIPPLLGWNDWPDHFTPSTPCTLTSERGFVIYSSSGSFFIPLIIMSIVYYKIFSATRRRLRARAKSAATRMNNLRSVATAVTRAASLPQGSDGQGTSKTAQGVTVLPAIKSRATSPQAETAGQLSQPVSCGIPSDEFTEEISPPDAQETIESTDHEIRGSTASVTIRKRSRFTSYFLGDGETTTGLLGKVKRNKSVFAITSAGDSMKEKAQVRTNRSGSSPVTPCHMVSAVEGEGEAMEKQAAIQQSASRYKMSFFFGEKKKNTPFSAKKQRREEQKQERVMMHVMELASSSCNKLASGDDLPAVGSGTAAANKPYIHIAIEKTSATSPAASASSLLISPCDRMTENVTSLPLVKRDGDEEEGEKEEEEREKEKGEDELLEQHQSQQQEEQGYPSATSMQVQSNNSTLGHIYHAHHHQHQRHHSKSEDVAPDERLNCTTTTSSFRATTTAKRFPVRWHSVPSSNAVQGKSGEDTKNGGENNSRGLHVDAEVEQIRCTTSLSTGGGNSTLSDREEEEEEKEEEEEQEQEVKEEQAQELTLDGKMNGLTAGVSMPLSKNESIDSSSGEGRTGLECKVTSSSMYTSSEKNNLPVNISSSTGVSQGDFADGKQIPPVSQSGKDYQGVPFTVKSASVRNGERLGGGGGGGGSSISKSSNNGNRAGERVTAPTVVGEHAVQSLLVDKNSKFHHSSNNKAVIGSSASSSLSTSDVASRTHSVCKGGGLDGKKSSVRRKATSDLDQDMSTTTSTTAASAMTEDAFPLVKVAKEAPASLRSSILEPNTSRNETKTQGLRASSVPCVGFTVSKSFTDIKGGPKLTRKSIAASNIDESRANSNLLCVDSPRYTSTVASGATSSGGTATTSNRSKLLIDLESSFGSSLPPSTLGAATTGSHPSVMTQVFEEKQQISLSRERKAARVLGIVMGVFVACWLPFFLMYVILAFVEQQIPRWLENGITWLGYVNSALNPIIYTVFNLDFRRGFMKILNCK